MAKKNVGSENGNGVAARQKGFTGHHQRVMASGETLTFESRPRGAPYKLQEWLDADRRYTYRKVYDNGKVITFVESAVEDYSGQ